MWIETVLQTIVRQETDWLNSQKLISHRLSSPFFSHIRSSKCQFSMSMTGLRIVKMPPYLCVRTHKQHFVLYTYVETFDMLFSAFSILDWSTWFDGDGHEYFICPLIIYGIHFEMNFLFSNTLRILMRMQMIFCLEYFEIQKCENWNLFHFLLLLLSFRTQKSRKLDIEKSFVEDEEIDDDLSDDAVPDEAFYYTEVEAEIETDEPNIKSPNPPSPPTLSHR